MRGMHRVPHKGPFMRKVFPFYDVSKWLQSYTCLIYRGFGITFIDQMTSFKMVGGRFQNIISVTRWPESMMILTMWMIMSTPLIARFMGPTYGPPGATGPRWAPCCPMNFAIWDIILDCIQLYTPQEIFIDAQPTIITAQSHIYICSDLFTWYYFLLVLFVERWKICRQ